jgi:uncharacterized Ntn-hydrolase superfamily protein
MTFSICVREEYEDDGGNDQTRFGVAVTTRLAGVGTLCPFTNEHGAVATQSVVNVDLGRMGVEYLADGLHIEDALGAQLAADEGAEERQLHGVDGDAEFAFSGEECNDWFGHYVGDNYRYLSVTGEVAEQTTAVGQASRRSRSTTNCRSSLPRNGPSFGPSSSSKNSR